jgi:prephenate dehydrogenase
MALRQAGWAVVGVDRDPATARAAVARGAVDQAGTDLRALGEAEVTVVAVPLPAIVPVARAAAAHMRPGAVLTDTGSVKAPVVAALAGLPRVRFVGGHPMFGSEGQGIAAADASLLPGRPYVLTPVEGTDPEAVGVVEALVRSLAMRPVRLPPEMHDRLAAQVSHLPYLVALALAEAVEGEARAIAGPAFQEMTRVARSPRPMWAAIARANREAILAALGRFQEELAALRAAVASGRLHGDAALQGDTRREGATLPGAAAHGDAAHQEDATEEGG